MEQIQNKNKSGTDKLSTGEVWLWPSLQELQRAVDSNLDGKRGSCGGGRVHGGRESLASSVEICPDSGGVWKADFRYPRGKRQDG